MIKNFYFLILCVLAGSIANGQSTGFGASKSCNVNAVCEPDWCNQRRSVGLIFKLDNGVYKRSSTGSLLTNEKRDGRPYFLTANHILDADKNGTISATEQLVIDSLMVVFNYQADNCTPNTPAIEPDTTEFVIIGAKLIAHSCGLSCPYDFALLELSERPDGRFNAYYNGWDNSDAKPKNGGMIHHPKTDIKKISLYTKKPKKKLNDTWQVKWKNGIGTSETGSSGAPLYDADKLVIGQQSTADMSFDPCHKKYKIFAGRFAKSWDKESATDEQLRHWLSPNSTNNFFIQAMSGDEFHCKLDWSFTNASDLHTSANINGLTNVASQGTRMYDGHYEATNSIVAGGNVNIVPSTNVEFDAGTVVHLLPGFHAQLGSTFRAHIDGCVRGCGTGVGKTGNEEKEPYIVLNTDKKTTEPEDENTDLNENYDFKVYPNPNTGRFTIEFDINEDVPTELYVYNLLGKIVWRQENLMGNRKVIDISSQPKGIYFIRVQQDENTYTQKLIHQ